MEYIITALHSVFTGIITVFTNLTPGLTASVLIILLFTLAYLVFSRILKHSLAHTNLAPSLRHILVYSVLKWVFAVFAIITILNQIGIDVTAALAGVGIIGIAIGFAAKETLANMLAGLSIFIDELYVVGDWVEVADKYGEVKRITLRTTKIRTLDNIYVIIPNHQITSAPVTNFTENGEVRINATIGISYNSSIEHAREVILSTIAKIEGVRTSPAPEVVVEELGDSSVNLLVRMWVSDPGTDPKYRFLLMESCKTALDEAGIEIPFPQRVLHHAEK